MHYFEDSCGITSYKTPHGFDWPAMDWLWSSSILSIDIMNITTGISLQRRSLHQVCIWHRAYAILILFWCCDFIPQSWSTPSSGRYDCFCDILTFTDYCRPIQLSWWPLCVVVEVIVGSLCVRCGTVANASGINWQFEWVARWQSIVTVMLSYVSSLIACFHLKAKVVLCRMYVLVASYCDCCFGCCHCHQMMLGS
jgi:hypothetical protein